jgi:HlyD family secretion protein
MQYFFRKPVIAVVAVAAAVFLFLLWRHAHSGPSLTFQTARVKRGDVAATITASGTIEPVEVVDIGAQVAGIIKSFGTDTDGNTIDYGSTVEKDAVLARIDDSVYAANLGVARAQVEQDKAAELNAAANLEQMKAKLDQAEAEWKRAQTLLAEKLMANVDYDTDKANYEVARADVSAAEAGVAQAKATTVQGQAGVVAAQRDLDFCTIRSPVRGVIIDRRVNIGETVVSSLNAPSLFLIAEDLTRMQIWVSVNEADVGRIKPGAPVTFTCDAFPGRKFKGVVGKVRLNATMTQNVVTYTVEVNMDNSDKVLLPYLTANVRFTVEKTSDALLVPNAALRWSPPSLAQISPDARSQKLDPPPDDGSPAIGIIWLKKGQYVWPLEVKLGTSDGVNTAVSAENLNEGDEAVTGATGSAQDSTLNPFMPPTIKR